MSNKPLEDALKIAQAAREAAVDDHVKESLDGTIEDIQTSIENNN